MKKLLTLAMLLSLSLLFWACGDNPVEPTETDLLELVSSVSTIDCATDATLNELETTCVIKNISDDAVMIKLNLYVESITDGHKLQPCWNEVCTMPIAEDKQFSEAITLAAGASTTTTEFVCHLETGGVAGTTVIRFEFYCVDAEGNTMEDQKVEYTATYTVTEAVDPGALLVITEAIETVNCAIDASHSELETTCVLENITTGDIKVKLNMYVESIAEGHNLQPCWNEVCTMPLTESKQFSDIITLVPGQTTTTTEFVCHLETGDAIGTSVVRFEFYCVDQMGLKIADSEVEYTCTYNVTEAVDPGALLVITEAIETVNCAIDANYDDFETSCTVTNATSSDLKVKLNMYIESLTAGHDVLPCWNEVCLPPQTENKAFPAVIDLPAGGFLTETDFVCHLGANGITGTTVIRFEFYCVDQMGSKIADSEVDYTCTYTITE